MVQDVVSSSSPAVMTTLKLEHACTKLQPELSMQYELYQ
jgi:hypothetical protein